MSDLIVIRLHPDKPIAGSSFTSYLDGLTIKAFDLSLGDAKHGIEVGQASFIPPLAGDPPGTPNPNTRIAQHFTSASLPAFPDPESVATAVIELNLLPAGYKEFVSSDLRIEISRAGIPISVKQLYYDVIKTTGSTNPSTYLGIPASNVGIYLKLPRPLSGSAAGSLLLNDDGSPPNFDELKIAVNAVLSADNQSVPPGLLGNLTPEQARHVANEIIWGPQDPLPQPPGSSVSFPSGGGTVIYDGLGALYSNPPNDGSLSSPQEQNRQQFEGDLSSYYATHNANVDRLARYVFAISAAVACQTLTTDPNSPYSKTALLKFPVNPAGATPGTTIGSAEVLLVDGAGGPLLPAFDVPAEYFYVLGISLPLQVGAVQRFLLACRDNQERLLPLFTLALDDGTIALPSINPAQAVRRITALAPASSQATPCKLDASILVLVQDWLAFPAIADWEKYVPGDDTLKFWKPEATGTTAQQQAYLQLVLRALTGGYQPLIDAVIARLPAAQKSIAGLAALTLDQWKSLFLVTAKTQTDTPTGSILAFAAVDIASVVNGMFVSGFHIASLTMVTSTSATQVTMSPAVTGDVPKSTTITFTNPALLPPLTLPGTFDTRLNAFIRRVQKFFKLSFTASAVPKATADAPPILDLPTVDVIAQFVTAYAALVPPPFQFGAGPLNQTDVDSAVQVVFPGEPAAQSWLNQRVRVINDLCFLATVVSSSGTPPKLNNNFTIAEALYARGFTSIEDVKALSINDFTDALRGTVAFSIASSIYAKAGATGPLPPPPPGPFQPINPGSLVNCIPPCYLSPLGTVEYLHELLKLSEGSTCQNPFPGLPKGKLTLGDTLAQRRGPLGDLSVTSTNAETPIPLIDIVNENLENLVAILPASPKGIIYDTATHAVGGHKLCKQNQHDSKDCHEAITLLEALPEHSSPAVPVGQPTAYDKLKLDFSAPTLPYSQPLDLCRTYLDHFKTCRFETMRTFRREITEFTLDPTLTSPPFQSHLWRYPVRIDIAMEYLQITPEEYEFLFTKDIANTPTPGSLVLHGLYGFDDPQPGGMDWTSIVLRLPEFLKRTGLTYCELVELQKSDCFHFVVVKPRSANDRMPPDERGILPNCEPCCLEHYFIRFLRPEDQTIALRRLVVFLRLWRKLQAVCGARYSFTELCDICDVLELFQGSSINPDFIRQLVSFQILRDQLRLKLTDGTMDPGTAGADRTHLLALWVGPSAVKWNWALNHLLDRMQHFARHRHECRQREPHFIKLLSENLDPLSVLAGFDPQVPSDTWHMRPTNTLRFVEILAKIYASHFGIGEILYLFTADDHLDGDDPFPLQDRNEALDNPLGLPDDDEVHDLWHLRRKLLATEVASHEAHEWNWHRIEAAIRHEFGYVAPTAHDNLLSFGQHFFPTILEHAGVSTSSKDRQYRVALAATAADMWNIPPDGPFRYDSGANELWTHLPLRDEAVVEKLERLGQLSAAEQVSVQNLYFLPRIDLASFACFFPSLAAAERHLIEEPDEEKRWDWFRHHFVLAHKRCEVITEHLVKHVASATNCDWPGGLPAASLILRHLFADENRAVTTWEADDGVRPDLTWNPLQSGSAFSALLGLTGTGLLGEFHHEGGKMAWREVRGPMSAFGHEKNEHNSPVPTILPFMDLTLTPQQLKYVEECNGFGIQDKNGKALGGVEGFAITWSGVLLVDEEGRYEFTGGAPSPEGEEPKIEGCEHHRWRVRLTHGQKNWILLSHHWPGEHGHVESSLSLKRGAYGITVEFVQPTPNFSGVDDIHPQRTGFQVNYSGPDTGGCSERLPLDRLYRDVKDETLDVDIDFPNQGDVNSRVFLKRYSTSTLRDIRRTYQRAFKALLFTHRFALSGHPVMPYRQSELGYLLDHADLFVGVSYFRDPVSFSRHAVNFDFNFLPLKDQYHPPLPAQDQRAQPTPKREKALFDWWERIFDYTRMRHDVERRTDRSAWLLFEESLEKQPVVPDQILRHLDVDLSHARLVLSYFQNQTTAVKHITSSDLDDDRWAVRVWHSDRWTRRLLQHFHPFELEASRPNLWASDDPGALVSGESETGDANLSQFLCNGCFENGEPRRYTDVKLLNNGLRERARSALLVYLCSMNRVPVPWGGTAKSAKDLSALLLLDVEAGLCERASRIEEAITATQIFILRARLGHEAGWSVTAGFMHLWKHEFELYRVWEKCKCRSLYQENWIDWDELRKARKIEAFQLLETELRRSTLTIAVPGGLEYWPESLPPVHPAVKLLQQRDPSTLRLLNPAREGLGVLGTPERDARPSWLAPDLAPKIDRSPPVPRDPAGPAIRNQVIIDDVTKFPFWIQAAIRLGTKFVRVAAGGVPPASEEFHPTDFHQEPGCCQECGCVHPPHVDEFYFWLVNSQVFDALDQDEFYDPGQQASAKWHDETELPRLLDWKSSSAARLAWCRVHNGEFKQPRRSDDHLSLDPNTTPDLEYIGRIGDSLTFSVVGGIISAGFNGKDGAGFRYDMATDSSVVLPLVDDPLPANSSYPAGLPVYPYFVFVEPGDRLFPESLFSPAVSVAGVLRCHCRFEPALKWYQLVLNPLEVDNIWVHCDGDVPSNPTPPRAVDENSVNAREVANGGRGQVGPPFTLPPETCCDSTNISAETARHRAILLHYVETLVEWSKALMRQNSAESAQQARLVLDTAARILGPCPKTVINHEPPAVSTVTNFTPLIPPLNPRLMQLYCHVKDGLDLVHRCMTESRLRNSTKGCRPPYWGQDPCNCGPFGHQCGCEVANEPCCDEDDLCRPHSPYRFVYLVQKAQEAASRVRECGNALMSAYDRGDGEYLASMRARHETQLADMTIKVRQDQWRDADWQIAALGKTKEVSQTNQKYFKRLIGPGGGDVDSTLNNGEAGYQSNVNSSIDLQTAAIPIEITGEVMRLIPDLFVGFPCEEAWIPLGSKLGEMFQTIARIIDEGAKIADTSGSLDLTQGGWQRRLDEWVHQVEILEIEIEQNEIQILGAERRRNQAIQELNIQQSQFEQSREMLDSLRDKFTSHELFLFLQKETSVLYWKMYELAHHLALEAQRAFNFELGYLKRNFLGCEDWDNLHEGLLAGERLQLSLQRMESEYVDCNRRDYELTKHISLSLHFPMEFLKLKITGCCEIEIPEWMFDKDYPGHYMRRIKSVSLTIPCVTGPYSGVHCRLTLLHSQTRIDPCLPCPVTECCHDKPTGRCGCRHESHEHYESCCGDQRVIKHYGAREAIATSSGRNDSGLFELNFHDERHLPFEFYGTVSCWRIEIPPENNFFDMDSLTELCMHMNFVAREGGAPLRDAARSSARNKLPGNGWIFLDLRKDFPDTWELFRRSKANSECERSMTIKLSRKLFPFLPDDPAIRVCKLALLLETDERCQDPCPEIEGCPCGTNDVPGSQFVEVTVEHSDDRDDCAELELYCVRNADWPELYHGVSEINVGPIDRQHDCHTLTLTFDNDRCGLNRAFLLCRYEVAEKCCETKLPIKRDHHV